MDRNPLNFFKMGPATETLSVRVQSSDCWQIVNNVHTHQDARPQNLILDPPSLKCITVEDFNSRNVEWEPETRKPPTDTAIGTKLHPLIQSNPNIILVNTPRIPTTLSETTLTLSIVSQTLHQLLTSKYF